MKLTIMMATGIFLAQAAAAALNVHPVRRTQIRQDAAAVYYSDLMSDGTRRDSVVAKPTPPAYPERVEIVATNETATMWELVYSAVYAGGEARTNSQCVVKTEAADRLRKPAAERVAKLPPMPPPAKVDALGQARARHVAAALVAKEIKEHRTMAPTETTRLEAGEIVRTLGGKEVSRTPVRRATSARVASAPTTRHDGSAGTDTPANGAVAAGAAAAAFAAGVVAGRKSKG